jgi:hypothetical protein
LLETNVISGSPSTIELTWNESVYSSIRVELDNVRSDTNADELRLRVGHTNGTILATGYNGIDREMDATTWDPLAASTYFEIAQSVKNTTTFAIDGVVRITSGRGVRTGCLVRAEMFYEDTLNAPRGHETQGLVSQSDIIDTVQFLWNSGDFDNQGDIKIYGLRR